MAPLGIGLFVLSLSFVLTMAASASLFVFQKRLTNYAEMAAVYSATQSRHSSDFLSQVGSQNFSALQLSEQLLPDGLTVKITACAEWNTPVGSYLHLPAARVCSHASARAG